MVLPTNIVIYFPDAEMATGKVCTCRFGITAPSRKQRLFDLIQAFVHEEERANGKQQQDKNCGVTRMPTRQIEELRKDRKEVEFRPRPAASYRGDRV